MMRRWKVVVLMVGILGGLGCESSPSCESKPHFQIISADVTVWKTGYPGIPENMQQPANVEKTAIKVDTCSGEAWTLREVDDKKAAYLEFSWVHITGS